MPRSLLLVDDDPLVRGGLRRCLRGEGYEIAEAGSADEALAILRQRAFDIVIADLHMPGMSGIELLKVVRIRWPDTLRIVLTGKAELDLAIQAINGGDVYRFLLKPWDNVDMRVIVRLALQYVETQRENARLAGLAKEQERTARSTRPPVGPGAIRRDPTGRFVILEEEDEEEFTLTPLAVEAGGF